MPKNHKTILKIKHDDFLEYVVGGDSLLPKRIRSKKSDLPYSRSNGSESRNFSPHNNILEGLQA